MTALHLRVNGQDVASQAEPRTHLADFLRETLLLTGTHLGCEHGVCGACTVLLDGEPARSCIAYAVDCAGREVHSIEGLEHDPTMAALRTAFSAEHALQCGYCTPGMLVTARDIVLRLPHADDDRIRLELAGNLCRCTGYNGIVRAIRRVLDSRAGAEPRTVPRVAMGRFDLPAAAADQAAATRLAPSAPGDPNRITQTLRFGLPAAELWAAVQDPALIAGCVPGATLTANDGERIEGRLSVALGPIKGSFTGGAMLRYDREAWTGRLQGHGQDGVTGTRLSGSAEFAVTAEGDAASRLQVEIGYALRGPLAQFGRGPVVRVLAAEIAAQMGQALEARLRGQAAPAHPRPLRTGGIVLQAVLRRLRLLLHRRHTP